MTSLTFVAPFSDILILARFRVLMKVQNFNLARITGVAHKTVLHFFLRIVQLPVQVSLNYATSKEAGCTLI